MSLRIGSPDTFPYVVGVYVCRCGRNSEQHGRHAGELPPDWVRLGGGEEGEHMCPVCAAWAEANPRS